MVAAGRGTNKPLDDFGRTTAAEPQRASRLPERDADFRGGFGGAVPQLFIITRHS
jgi:hypothetical protein